jgi:hypothetical protein
MYFADFWQDLQSEQNANSCIDDTSTGVNDAIHDEPLHWTEMFAPMQSVAQIWERLLYSLGGNSQMLLVHDVLGVGSKAGQVWFQM